MRVLVLSDEVWNDKVNSNNVVSNWFEGMGAEFANIYASPGEPCNKCCSVYYQITDSMMFRSLFSSRRKAGRVVSAGNHKNFTAETEPRKLYAFLKSISGSFLRLVRELIWIFGKYDLDGLQKFIDDFNPDITFFERMATCKMLRLEKIVTHLSKAPVVAFTGDDEYSLKRLTFSPFFWMNRFMVRSRLREMVRQYKIYYTLSSEQKADYERRFHCNMKILHKGADFDEQFTARPVHQPVRMIYAGKFYCGRWKVLAQIAGVLRDINHDGVKMILEIYTKDTPTVKQNRLLNDRQNSFIMGAVSQEELKQKYQNSDIALHVESTDIRNRLNTRLSFSTKIVDCLASGCAVLAYCWEQHSGFTYLQREKAAICVSAPEGLKRELINLCEHPEKIQMYARRAHECGVKNHQRVRIQEMLFNDFRNVIQENRQ